jgi:voltage-gated potassium channel
LGACKDAELRALLSLMIILLISGTVFYVSNEGWSYIDALYFCVMTMSTVGYGDLVPTSNLSKIFTMVYAVISIGAFVAMVSKLAKAMLARSAHAHG